MLFKNFRPGPKWLQGTLVERTAPYTYKLLCENCYFYRHADHICSKAGLESCDTALSGPCSQVASTFGGAGSGGCPAPMQPQHGQGEQQQQHGHGSGNEGATPEQEQREPGCTGTAPRETAAPDEGPPEVEAVDKPQPRRSARARAKPDHFGNAIPAGALGRPRT